MRIILFNKPYGVLSQFTDPDGRPTLAHHLALPGFRPAGRLDHDSEGLLLLTDDGRIQARIAHPRFKLPKTYWVQVEGTVTDEALGRLASGVGLSDGTTLPARAEPLDEPALWPCNPPIRFRKSVPTSWLALTIQEGRNRQVRRMTAAVGLPTLRLVRWSIGPFTLTGLAPGDWREVDPAEAAAIMPPPDPHRSRPGVSANVRLETSRHRRQPRSGGGTVPAGRGADRREGGDQPAGRSPGRRGVPRRRGRA